MFRHTFLSMEEGNQEAEIFRHCFPSGAPPTSEPGSHVALAASTRSGPPQRHKRQRPDHQRQHLRGPQLATYHPPPQYPGPFPSQQERQQQQIVAMSKLLLQHEDKINNLNLDRGMVLFLKEDARSILPSMMQTAKEWNAKKEQGDQRLTSPLRTVLLASMIKELQQRMQTISATQEGRASLQKAKWMTEGGDWCYLQWCRKTKTLIPNEAKHPLTHAEAVRVLNFLYSNLKEDIILTFKSTQKLQHLEDQNRLAATFILEISLRGAKAQEVYESFEILINSSLTGLIGMSLKKESTVRKPMAAHLAQMVFGH